MRVTLSHWFTRTITACAVAAAASAASAQSFYHAPPTSQDAALLPTIRPAFRAAVQPIPEAAQPVAPADDIVNAEKDQLPRVPAHLSSNVWKRLPAPAPAASAAMPPAPPEPHQAAFHAPPPPAVSFPHAKPTPDPAHLRSIASRSLARGDVAAAETQLTAALTRFPSDLQLAISLARVRETRGDWTGAVAAFDAVIQLDPTEPRWKTRRAECHYFSGHFENAVNDYLAAETASAPLTVSECIRFGDAALRANRLDVAESAFSSVSRLTKEPLPQVELLRGLVALKQGNPDQARTILLRANGVWPNDPQLTEALRVASAARNEPGIPIARVHSNQGLHALVPSETRDDEHRDSPVSGWRPTRVPVIGEIRTASAGVGEPSVGPTVVPIADEEDGWHATSKVPEQIGSLQPDDGAVLAVPGAESEPHLMP
jgi:tetratricopeptide (TPR) repeat protein